MGMMLVGGSGWDVPTMNSAVDQAMDWTIIIGAFLATTFTSVKFAYLYFSNSVGAKQGNDVNVTWDWQEVVRIIFILMVLGVYKPISTGVTETFRYLNNATQASSDVNGRMQKAANKHYIASVLSEHEQIRKAAVEKFGFTPGSPEAQALEATLILKDAGSINQGIKTDGTVDGNSYYQSEQYDQYQDKLNSEPTEQEKLERYLQMVASSGASEVFTEEVMVKSINELSYFFASMVKWIAGTFVKMIFQIGLIFGPLVLAFSIFMRDKVITYFNQMLTLGFVFTTLNVLDLLFTHFMEHSLNDPSIKESVAFNLTMIAAYLSAFKLTSLFVGATGLNSIVGRILGVGGAGTALLLSSAGGAKGLAAGAANASRGTKRLD